MDALFVLMYMLWCTHGVPESTQNLCRFVRTVLRDMSLLRHAP